MEKWNVKNLLILGAGGIGSHLVEHLYKLMLNGQISMDTNITVSDNDKVELKNISYQNFTDKDILKNKAVVIGDRYGFVGQDRKIVDDRELMDFDSVVICVDNSKARKLVYDWAYKNKRQFIDLRAEGRQIAVITSDLKESEAKDMLPKEINGNGGSCQLKYRFENQVIDVGNIVVAAIGSQILLNKLRGEQSNDKLILRV